MPHHIVLFDGYCNYCSRMARWIMRYDRRDRFRLAASQSAAGKRVLEKHGILGTEEDSLILLEGAEVYLHSTAALRICRGLGGPLRVLYLLAVLPRFIRDPVYRLVARNRFRWFGRRKECFIPDRSQQHKFL